VVKNVPTNKFTKNILRTFIGEERAIQAFKSISQGVIPQNGSDMELDLLKKTKSSNDMQNLFGDKLQKLVKKMGNEPSVTIEEGGSSSEDSMEEDIGGNTKSMMNHDPVKDAAKLIDLELVKLLQYCHKLSETYKDNDDYQEEVMMKSIELGKKTKPKLLIFDMDETLVAAKFAGHVPDKF